MVSMVLVGFYGISFFNSTKMEKHVNLLAGLTILICGSGILFWNW
jgi:hypothetical protein